MRAALGIANEIGVSEDSFVVAIVVLQGDVERHAALARLWLFIGRHHAWVTRVREVHLSCNQNRLIVQRVFVGVQEGDVLSNTILKLENVFSTITLIGNFNGNSRDKEGQLTKATY